MAKPPSAPVDPLPPRLAMLIAMSAIGPMALNIFLPAMAEVAVDLNTSYAVVQLSLSVYLIGQAIAQLAYGPISDRFGRRAPLLVGLAIFMAGTAIIGLATDVWMLLIGRALQASGGAAGLVLGRAMVRDSYGRDSSASMIATITMVMILAPMISPLIGGLLSDNYGWRATQAFLAIVGAFLILASWRFATETIRVRQPLPAIKNLLDVYTVLLRQRRFRGYAFQTGLSSAAWFSFLGGAPYLAVDVLGQTATGYGLWFVTTSGGYMLGNMTSARLSRRFGVDRMIWWGVSIGVIAALTHLVVALTLPLSMAALFLPAVLLSFSSGLNLPNGLAGSMSVDPARAGAASGIAGFLQMGLGAIASMVVGALLVESQIPLSLVLVIATTLALAAHWDGQRAARASLAAQAQTGPAE